MKKQILTLTMCLALTATAGLALGTNAVAAKTPAKSAVSRVAKKAVKKVTPVANKQVAPQETLTPQQAARQQFEEKMAKERDNFYNKLGLSCEQKTKAETLDKTNRESAEPLFDAVRAEKAKLHDLQAKKACCVAIHKQEQKLKAAKKALRAHMVSSRKAFEAVLTKDQLAKFKAMKPARKFGCPCKCHHHHGHHGPEFGQQGPSPVSPTPEGAIAPAPKCPCKK